MGQEAWRGQVGDAMGLAPKAPEIASRQAPSKGACLQCMVPLTQLWPTFGSEVDGTAGDEAAHLALGHWRLEVLHCLPAGVLGARGGSSVKQHRCTLLRGALTCSVAACSP